MPDFLLEIILQFESHVDLLSLLPNITRYIKDTLLSSFMIESILK